MSKLFVSTDVHSNSLEFIDQAVSDWNVNAQAEVYKFPDADITIVLKDSDVYLMSKRETFRKKVPFVPLAITTKNPEDERDKGINGIVLKPGDAEVDFMNAILAATTN